MPFSATPTLGRLTLANPVVMAPLTRCRGVVPSAANALYYAQRASAGLIIAEATLVEERGRGFGGTPGIYSAEQVAGWKLVTDAVHAAGGRIFLQLWHQGRTASPALNGGVTPVAPSAIAAKGWDGLDIPVRALELEEIPAIVAAYAAGAANALAAGFDGVEVHGANGYLLDQFLQAHTNVRTDAYGGSPANHARLLLEVTAAAAAVYGADRVGVRLSPASRFNGMGVDVGANVPAFAHVAEALGSMGLAYLHVVEPRVNGNEDMVGDLGAVEATLTGAFFKPLFKGPIISAGGHDAASGAASLAAGTADAIA